MAGKSAEALGKPPSLLRATLAAIAIAVTLLSLVAFVPEPLVRVLLESDSRKNAENWQNRILGLLSAGSDAFIIGSLTEEDKRRLEIFVRASATFRVKMFRAGGQVFWSSRASDLGQVSNKSYFFEEVAAGRIYQIETVKPASDVDGYALPPAAAGVPVPDRLVHEIYAPVMRDGRFLGAVEFYRDVTGSFEANLFRVRLAVGLVALLGVIATIGLVLMVLGTGRRRERFMAHLAERERTALAQDRKLSREMRLLSELNEWLQACKTLDELFDMVKSFMSNLFGACSGAVYVYSNSRDVLDGACEWNGGHLHAHIRPDDCWGLRRGRTYGYGQNEIDFPCTHIDGQEIYNYVCIPILAHGETVGLLHLNADPSLPADHFAEDRRLAQMCAEQISLAIANVRLRDQLRDQSIRDPLTGLFNRRHFLETLRRHLDRARRSGGALSLVSVDIDHFKKFNDNYGHDAGDMVLRAVGSLMEKLVDGDELPCRLGGEEFTVLLPGATTEVALRRAEELRRSVERIAVRYGEKTLPHVTISLGVATYPEHGDMPQTLMKVADDALYDAKARGRNQACRGGDTAAAPERAAGPEQAGPSEPVPADALERAIAAAGAPAPDERGGAPRSAGTMAQEAGSAAA
jgi:diguanylate cyclase (GGDEF)-like protein